MNEADTVTAPAGGCLCPTVLRVLCKDKMGKYFCMHCRSSHTKVSMCLLAGHKVRSSQNYDPQATFAVPGEPIKEHADTEIIGFEEQQFLSL